MSNRKRRPAHRAEPVRAPRGARVAAHRAEPERSPLAARVHDLTPARLAQGGVVAVLVAGLCTTITAQASASGNETDSGRTAAMAEARDGAVDVAADALVVADAVQIKAAHTTGVSAAKLAELRTAAAQVDALITEAEGRTSTTSDTRDAGDTTSADAPAASASPSATAQPSATSSPSATASSVPAASADTAASDAASPAASPAAASASSDDNAAAAGADPATDTATVAPSTLATSTAGHAVGATVPGATVAGTAKAAPPAPATASTAAASASTAAASASPTSTATAGTPTPTGTPTAGAGTTTPETSPTGASSTAFDAKVPTIPDTGGPEDQTTEDLRTAVARLATIAAEVRAEVADETARQAADQAAADQAAADKAAAQKAAAKKAADKAAADKAAAEKAAERKAAQRAAWKKSLQGFPNGRIPASALCGVPFDSSVLLRCDAAQALTALDKAYTRAFGHHLEVSDSYRSYGAQVSCRATKGYLCAEPGTSNHGWGVAVDLGGGIQSFGTSTHSWMNRNAAKFGWHHPGWAEPGGSKPEPWHWEYTA